MSAARIAGIVLTYWTISITTVFINKHLLSSDKNSTDVSVFIALFQCFMTVVFSAFTKWFRQRPADKDGSGAGGGFSIRVLLDKRILLMTTAYVGMLVTNNLCLRLVGVAFYQVVRSMTLAFTVMLAAAILREKVSCRVIVCCATVAGGFALGVNAEHSSGTLSPPGVVFGVMSSFVVALNGVLIKRALDAVNHDAVALSYYSNVGAVVMLIPMSLVSQQLQRVLLDGMLVRTDFLLPLLVSSLLSFLMGWISAVQIGATSPVTHHISANTKAVVQTLIAVAVSHEVKSVTWWCSVFVVFIGASLYAVVRMRESKAAAIAAASADVETGAKS